MLERLSCLMFGRQPVGEVSKPLKRDYRSVLIPATTEFKENGLDNLVIERLKNGGFINEDFAHNYIVNCCNSAGKIVRLEAGKSWNLNKKLEFFLRITNEYKLLYIVPVFKGYALHDYLLNRPGFELEGKGAPLTGKQLAAIKNLLIQTNTDKGILPKVIPADKELKESGIAQVVFERYKRDSGIEKVPACGVPAAFAHCYYGIDDFNYSIEVYGSNNCGDCTEVMIRINTMDEQRPAGKSYSIDDILEQEKQLDVVKQLIGENILVAAKLL